MISNQLPTVFLERIKKILTPEHFLQYLASFTNEKMTGFRVNTLKISVKDLLVRLEKQQIHSTAIPWCETGFTIPKIYRRPLTDTSEFRESLIYIQNPASMFASLVLAPQPGEEVLDLAAAPGGKTLHIAAMMQDRGRIAAVESVKDRFFRLKLNIKNSSAHIVQTYHKDGASIGRLVPNRFDRVLLDAPCSSEGRFDPNDPSSYRYWSEKKVLEMARKQKKLIFSAIQSLKPNGTLVYCTCSLSPEENEAIVDYALMKFKESLEILPIEVPFENYQNGLKSWQGHEFSPDVSKTVRIIPDRMMNGFFVCKIRKKLLGAN